MHQRHCRLEMNEMIQYGLSAVDAGAVEGSMYLVYGRRLPARRWQAMLAHLGACVACHRIVEYQSGCNVI
jgi:hypothetical protein